VPQAELVLVKSGLPFSLLEALLYRPSLSGDPDQDGQGHRPGGVGIEERQVGGVGNLAAISSQCRGELVAASAHS
jgi:hypothetical protein